MADQRQNGGIGSANLQIGTFNAGVSYSDVCAIAKDVFEANMAKFADKAIEIVYERAQELRDDLAAALSKKTAPDFKGFEQPEKQSALFEAQKGYAISGDVQLKEYLVKMIVDVAGEAERSMKSIVLSEAIKALPSLSAIPSFLDDPESI